MGILFAANLSETAEARDDFLGACKVFLSVGETNVSWIERGGVSREEV